MNFKIAFLIPSLVFVLASTVVEAKTTCYLGDSQSASAGTLFDQLKSRIREASELKSGLAVCNASTKSYMGTVTKGCSYKGVTHLKITDGNAAFQRSPGATATLASICGNADTVILQLGDNDAGDTVGVAKRAKTLADQLASQNKACIWIGPASVAEPRCAAGRAKKQAVSVAIKNALVGTKCKFIDSFELTKANPPTGDRMCLHYSTPYRTWANAVGPKLSEALGATGGGPSGAKPSAPAAGARSRSGS